MARIRAEMAPGFSWSNQDGATLLQAKIDSQQAELTKMATKLAKKSAENATLKSKLDKVAEERDILRRRYAHHNTSGKNAYAERRSQMNRDIKEIAIDSWTLHHQPR